MPSTAYHIYRNGKYITTVYSWSDKHDWEKKSDITIKEERL